MVSAVRPLMPAVVSTPAALALPPTIHQFAPHTTFAQMQDALPAIAQMGYGAIQIPPIHAPGQVEFDGKLGSAYAPRDLRDVSPHMYAGVSGDDYLAGNFRPGSREHGWQALQMLAGRARARGLKVVGDLVFAHTAADPDVVSAHEEEFGKGFYRAAGTGGAGHSGATLEDGSWDTWHDIRPIDHTGPARQKIFAHLRNVVERFLNAGVTVFRADAAPRIPNDFWRPLIEGARSFAERHGIERPVFYAEALGTRVEDEVHLVRDGGFDAVTTSLRWWPQNGSGSNLGALRNGWLIDRTERVRAVGGAGVAFFDNHDTERGVLTYHGLQRMITQLGLTAFMSASMTVLDGTRTLDKRQPSVFLNRHEPVLQEPLPAGAADARAVSGALDLFFELKARYPILRSPAYTELIQDGSPIIRIQRTTPTEQVVIALNVGTVEGAYHVPASFSHGNIFGVNTWPGGETWFGAGSDTPITDYRLAPGGMTVFHRNVSESEGLRLPGFMD